MTKVFKKAKKMNPVDERAMRRWRTRKAVGKLAYFACFQLPIIAGLGLFAAAHWLDDSHVGGWQAALVDYTITATIPAPAVRPALPRSYAVDAAALECLALNTRYEAWGEGDKGMMAVMLVTQTRTAKGWLGAENECDATFAPQQFSWANAFTAEHDVTTSAQLALAKVTKASATRMDETIAWGISQMLAEKVLRGGPEVQALRDQLAGADHYYAEYIETPRWAHHPKMKFVTQIGLHKFYRWEG